MPRRRFVQLSILLVLGLLAVYLTGNWGPALFDRDEPRYAVTSRAMLETGDWVVPRFLGVLRTAKPPAIYWLQGGAMWLVGTGEFATRLPGALACATTVGLMAMSLPPLIGRRRALWACFFFGTCVLVLGVAKVGVIDGTLVLTMAIMQIAMLRMVRRRGSDLGNAVLLWTAVGVGGLLKGPVILGVLGMTLIAWRLLAWKRLQPPGGVRHVPLVPRLHWLLGVALVAIICGPWLVMIYQREPGFLGIALGHDVARRSVQGLESHGAPPGYHLVVLLGTWFPWSLLLPATILSAWRRRGNDVIRFALAAAIGPWIMFELVVTKLPHYLLPVFPMLAILTADLVVRLLRGRRGLRPVTFRIAAVVGAVMALGFAAAPVILGVLSIAGIAAALAWGTGMAILWWRQRLRQGLILAGTGLAVLVAIGYVDWLARAPLLNVSRRTAEALAEAGAEEVLMVDYKEPSLGWYAGERGIVAREAPDTVLATHDGFITGTQRRMARRPPEAWERWETVAEIPARLLNNRFQAAMVWIMRPREQADRAGGPAGSASDRMEEEVTEP